MTTATRNGRKPSVRVTTTQIMSWIEGRDDDTLTSGDVMRHFDISRPQAIDRLETLLSEGLLKQLGEGSGRKFLRVSRNGTKPILPADVTELDFLGKLASDCDQELARIDSEIEALEAARAELAAQEERLRVERAGVERARKVLA